MTSTMKPPLPESSTRITSWHAGGESHSGAKLAVRPERWTRSWFPGLAIVAVLALSACASNAVEESQELAAEGSAVPSGVVDATESAAQSSMSNNTTTIPAPPAPNGSPDGANGTIPFTSIVMSAAVALDEPSDFGTGLTVRINEADTADVISVLPGELGGPSVILAIEFSNSSITPIDLSRTTVDLSFGDAVPGVPLTTPPSAPVAGSLAPASSALGTYVFSVPEDQLESIVVTVKYSADAPTAVFTGSIEP